MSRIIRGFITAVCATVILLASACGSGGGGITPPPPPTDVCPNIAGVQSSIPSGMILDGNGNCVVPIVVEVLSVNVSAPATVFQDANMFPFAVVSVSVNASSNKGSVTTVCTLDKGPALCVGNINMALGSNSFVAVATSVATGLKKTDSTTIVVLPLTISGHVYVRTMTGEHCPSFGTRIISGDVGSVQDTTFVDPSTCAFSLNTRYAGTPNTRILLPEDSKMMGMLAHVDSKYYNKLELVTMEKSLTIPLGQFAGQVKAVNLDLPYLPSRTGEGFFYRFQGMTNLPGDPWLYAVRTFPKYPVPEQFCRNRSNQSITASDSIGYSALMVVFHQAFGQELFRQDPSANVCATGLGRQLYVNDSSGKIPNAGTTGNWTDRDIKGAGLNFATESSVTSHHAVLHEGIHSLGFGHVSPNAWVSIMCSGCTKPEQESNDITVDDVFWFSVMQTMANGQRLHNTPFGLPQLHQYWRTTHGEPEELVLVNEPTR